MRLSRNTSTVTQRSVGRVLYLACVAGGPRIVYIKVRQYRRFRVFATQAGYTRSPEGFYGFIRPGL